MGRLIYRVGFARRISRSFAGWLTALDTVLHKSHVIHGTRTPGVTTERNTTPFSPTLVWPQIFGNYVWATLVSPFHGIRLSAKVSECVWMEMNGDPAPAWKEDKTKMKRMSRLDALCVGATMRVLLIEWRHFTTRNGYRLRCHQRWQLVIVWDCFFSSLGSLHFWSSTYIHSVYLPLFDWRQILLADLIEVFMVCNKLWLIVWFSLKINLNFTI